MRLVFSGDYPDQDLVRATKNQAHVPGGVSVAKATSAPKRSDKTAVTKDSAPKKRSGSRLFTGLLLVLLAGLAVMLPVHAQLQVLRLVQGIVRTGEDHPQANAVVYLQDQKTLEVRTYITEADGHYRFGQMSSDVDYQLWAEYKGHKSKVRSISSFDSKKEFTFDLKVDASK